MRFTLQWPKENPASFSKVLTGFCFYSWIAAIYRFKAICLGVLYDFSPLYVRVRSLLTA